MQVKSQWGGNCFRTAGLFGRPGSHGRRGRTTQPTQKHHEMVRTCRYSEHYVSLFPNISQFIFAIFCRWYVSVVNRDRKRKRFVRETGKEDQKKRKIKIDDGQVIANKKNKKNLYPFWQTLSFTVCSIVLLYHLTTFQLWGMEEEIQDRWCRVGQRNRRRRSETTSR